MKSHDEDEAHPSPEELREAAALAAALEGDAAAKADAGAARRRVRGIRRARSGGVSCGNARTPLAVPAAHEAIVTTHAAPALDARRVRRSRRARSWIATSLAATAAAGWLLFAMTLNHRAPSRTAAAPLPPAPADLLAAQAEAARGGSQTRAALAALDLKMRDYRRQYQQSLRPSRRARTVMIRSPHTTAGRPGAGGSARARLQPGSPPTATAAGWTTPPPGTRSLTSSWPVETCRPRGTLCSRSSTGAPRPTFQTMTDGSSCRTRTSAWRRSTWTGAIRAARSRTPITASAWAGPTMCSSRTCWSCAAPRTRRSARAPPPSRTIIRRW